MGDMASAFVQDDYREVTAERLRSQRVATACQTADVARVGRDSQLLRFTRQVDIKVHEDVRYVETC